MKNPLFLCVVFVALVAFEWAAHYNETLGLINRGLIFVFFVWVLVRLRQLQKERQNSGLSEEEFLLKQAGGASALLSQSITVRAIGWLCVVGPLLLVSIVLIGTKSLSATAMATLLLAVISVPCAIACFRSAAKSRRVAKSAGAKVW